jgi:hypothetical protein
MHAAVAAVEMSCCVNGTDPNSNSVMVGVRILALVII